MKLTVLLLALLGGVWLWQRGGRVKDAQAPTREPAAPKPMLRCAHCGVHVPGEEAVAGQRGSYCGAAHRREAEGR
jgi:uncharacterized protein